MRASKVVTMSEAAAPVPDGARVARSIGARRPSSANSSASGRAGRRAIPVASRRDGGGIA